MSCLFIGVCVVGIGFRAPELATSFYGVEVLKPSLVEARKYLGNTSVLIWEPELLLFLIQRAVLEESLVTGKVLIVATLSE